MVLSIGIQLQVRAGRCGDALALCSASLGDGGSSVGDVLEDMTLESVLNDGWGTVVQQRVGQWALQAEEAVGASWCIGDL